ncbi:plasmid replication protein, CyRepA1 family, partial [Nostoc parmelioides]|nr:hypothetical protein [Nostoc parmelioides FACHB-3921]
ARFNAEHWKQPLVIIDESEQVIWHSLSATTEVKKHRVEVLNQLSQLFKNAIAPGRGRIIVADADLSDLSAQMVMGLAETKVTPWVVVNTWKGQPWNIYNYKQTTPICWLAALEAHIKTGGKPFIAVDAQKAKSKWGTKVLEAKLKKKFPNHRILRIDSETIVDPEHAAYACIERLNQILMEYDIVLASPSIGTGVSIDIRGHFTSVWGCFQGVAPENATRQALARVREEVERHLWVARHGVGKVGNGATNVKSLLASEHQCFKANLRLLQDASMVIDGDEININRTALTIFGKMSCRINAGMIHYRESVVEALTDEGHNIIDVYDNKTRIILEKLITKQRDDLYNAECENVCAADTSHLTPAKYEALQQQRSKTTTERNIERKYKLEQRYGVEVTPELVKKDDAGYYPQLRLCYYLTVGRAYVAERDRSLGEKMLQAKSAWLPDFNGGQKSLVIHALEKFNIPNFIKSDRSLRGTDEDLVQMANNALSVKWQVKTVLDITLNDSDTPIVILRRFLKKIGLKLKYKGRDGTGDRQRIYHVVGADDGREQIFQHWLAKEKEKEKVAA